MSITLSIGQSNAEKIADWIKDVAGNVSANDIVEIVLKASEKEETDSKREEMADKPGITMTSREVADLLGRPHTTVVKQIAKFLCSEKRNEKESGFILTSFVCSHKNQKSYPMYEMTEKACREYRDLVSECGAGFKSVGEGIKRLDQAIKERFHPKMKVAMSSGFLLEGKAKSEYEDYCDLFNQFITGPAVEGREIAELTEKYNNFYEVLKAAQLEARISNELEIALFDVAIEAEMQGFIYGFKLFDALLSKHIAVAQ